MNPLTIDTSTIRLRKQGAGSDVAAAVSYGGNTATLDPDAALAPNAVYQVTVAGTITDASGNPLGTDDTWTFTTGAITGSATDTTVADFSAGTLDANTRVSQVADGEVILARGRERGVLRVRRCPPAGAARRGEAEDPSPSRAAS